MNGHGVAVISRASVTRRCDIGDNPYESPNTIASGAGPKVSTIGRAIVAALTQQAFILTFAALVLDGGRLLRVVSAALVVAWLVSLVVLVRYRKHPTPVGIGVVKYGFWFAVVVLLVLESMVGIPVLRA
jgi:hypothetical protein